MLVFVASVTPFPVARDKAARQGGLELLNRAEDLIMEMAGPIQRMPRSYRHRAGAMLEERLMELAELIIEAAASGQPSKVYRLQEHIRKVKFRISVEAKKELIRPKVAGSVMREPNPEDDRDFGGSLYQIEAMVGAWRDRIDQRKQAKGV